MKKGSAGAVRNPWSKNLKLSYEHVARGGESGLEQPANRDFEPEDENFNAKSEIPTVTSFLWFEGLAQARRLAGELFHALKGSGFPTPACGVMRKGENIP